MFSTLPKKTSFDFLFKSILSSENAFNLDLSKSLPFCRVKKCPNALSKDEKQQGHDGPYVSLHWLIREIHSYQTLHYLGIGLKHKTPYKV